MPGNITLQLLEEITALKARIAKLESAERNIDFLVLRDGITAPTAVSGLAFVYIDGTSGDLTIRYGDNFTPTIQADS